jgi:hypothetical protein
MNNLVGIKAKVDSEKGNPISRFSLVAITRVGYEKDGELHVQYLEIPSPTETFHVTDFWTGSEVSFDKVEDCFYSLRSILLSLGFSDDNIMKFKPKKGE